MEAQLRVSQEGGLDGEEKMILSVSGPVSKLEHF
jgi:hypothetical protein